jgi:CRISPR-associated endonuclease Csn1
MKIINQIMIDGYQRYDEAVRYALDNNLLPIVKKEKDIFLPPLKETDIDILNPTVIRAFAQFRKVANALVNKYGSFDKVHFELAREVNSKADIKGMMEGQRKNEKEREAAKVWITENFGPSVPLNRKNILKKRLYEQQDGRCVYTGDVIHLERLFDEGYCEIDHILPRSRSADDSFANKVLVMSKANQDKTNRTPYEWFGDDESAWERYEARINSTTNRSKMGMGKINRLLKKNFDENSEKEFLSRNLNDTRYMAKSIKTYCENHWALAHEDDKLRIQVRSGKLTSELRSRWIEGYMKDRSIHTHHALDAIVIAFATQSMVQKLSTYYGAKETRRVKEKPIFAPPMEHFREAVAKALSLERSETISAKDGREITLNRLLISRPPRASVTGAAHKETIQSPSDYKGRGVAVNNGKGMCDNGDMPRVDVFSKDGKYYLVPIYVADFAKEELPNRIVSQSEKEITVDATYVFMFSLHKEDVIEVKTPKTKSKESKIAKGFFVGIHSGNGKITLSSIDNSENELFENDKTGKAIFQTGSMTLEYITKYTIDPLGYYYEVKGEKRLGTIPQEAKKWRK